MAKTTSRLVKNAYNSEMVISQQKDERRENLHDGEILCHSPEGDTVSFVTTRRELEIQQKLKILNLFLFACLLKFCAVYFKMNR